jgi:hypothetical protein
VIEKLTIVLERGRKMIGRPIASAGEKPWKKMGGMSCFALLQEAVRVSESKHFPRERDAAVDVEIPPAREESPKWWDGEKTRRTKMRRVLLLVVSEPPAVSSTAGRVMGHDRTLGFLPQSLNP